MNIPQELRTRINFQGEITELLTDVCIEYGLGEFVSFETIIQGDEDVNLRLTTSKNDYFVKIFAERRDDVECLRLINIIKNALDMGVLHPQFLTKDTGYIFRNRYENFNIRLAVFEFIKGKTFRDLKRNPNTTELKEIISMVAKINSIDYIPLELYDKKAIVNFVTEFEKTKEYLSGSDIKMLEKLQKEFEAIDLKDLPYTLVHGDITETNIIKSGTKIYIVDFSRANYYPRIVELAVLMSNIMFDESGKESTESSLKFLLKEYQKFINLTDLEISTLPLFVKLAHAMNFITAVFEKEAKKNKSEENKNLLNLSKKGLAQTKDLK